ncbi:MAG: DNA polymerase III subunit gamma/tau, partial [Patescibacteria group bacterium]
MSQSLYQKYRPQAFADVVGQEPVKESLRNQVMRNKVTHAYLFTGPRGVGKTTLARILARAVNCENPTNGEPDNLCASCKRILDGAALDVIEIDAASHTGVDNVREHVITAARVPPVGLKRKVFIIDEVHMLSTSAFNALLKTLEEPPEHALFIMATTESHKIPMTIVSRCQRFDFKRILLDQMVDRLSRVAKSEGVEVDRAVLDRVAAKSEGALRDAETLLGQLFALGETKISEDVAELVLPRSQIQLVLG